ncbi:Ger(x)C family spore germination protein [Paenibacillus sp. UNC451MF]|uniref:Ger(x)C family spore germination protein n=1 Tax=Paenibacillus sp. UNC451MF TaxID=1449063 RepID=UPI00055CDE86|nr:Ger(x)C family spore germination protein [Paenibacillus sp. UNC451MF]
MANRIGAMVVIIIISFLTTGCWDRIEIDERGFVIGLAIDAIKEVPEKGSEGDSNNKKKRGKFVVTYQLVIPSGLKQGGSTSGVAGGGSKAFFNMTLEGDTLTSIAAKLSTKTSRAPFFEHLQVVLISEEVARKQGAFADVIDYFLRDSEMRRSLKVLVVKGDAKQVLEVNPPNEKLPVKFISSAAENTRKSSRMLAESRLGEVHEKLLKRESYLIQVISATKDMQDISIVGSALFDGQTNNLIGIIGGKDTAGINFIKENIKGGVVNAEVDQQLIGYEINWEKRSTRVDVSNPERLVFHIHIKTKGTIDQSLEQLDLTKEETITKLEEGISKEVKRITDHVIHKLQKEYVRDVFDLELFLYQEHYPTWKKIKDDWEEGKKLFSKAKIEVTVDTEVQRSGSILKSERSR